LPISGVNCAVLWWLLLLSPGLNWIANIFFF
jgi:hypothetical protein